MSAMESYYGHVRTQLDAILLFEACRKGIIPRISRRLTERERLQIRSGSIYVWDETEASMRRWTDSKTWSASRVSGSFLTYREMEPMPHRPTPYAKRKKGGESHRYKVGGLFKQSFSITTSTNLKFHMICYYTKEDLVSGKLLQPSMDPKLKNIALPLEMYPDNSSAGSTLTPVTTTNPLNSGSESEVENSGDASSSSGANRSSKASPLPQASRVNDVNPPGLPQLRPPPFASSPHPLQLGNPAPGATHLQGPHYDYTYYHYPHQEYTVHPYYHPTHHPQPFPAPPAPPPLQYSGYSGYPLPAVRLTSQHLPSPPESTSPKTVLQSEQQQQPKAHCGPTTPPTDRSPSDSPLIKCVPEDRRALSMLDKALSI
ncbi:hypothetical protein TRVA0_006S02872 [Trichomonascus vanleenenianus]|uniref:uncharacterized protein n=1 Tax=Trichomonascus vanleenenianus TaxID=2268995 RepID=UPI003ECA1882